MKKKNNNRNTQLGGKICLLLNINTKYRIKYACKCAQKDTHIHTNTHTKITFTYVYFQRNQYRRILQKIQIITNLISYLLLLDLYFSTYDKVRLYFGRKREREKRHVNHVWH